MNSSFMFLYCIICAHFWQLALTPCYSRVLPEKYRAAQEIFVSDVAAVFLWHNDNAYLIKPYVLYVWDHHSTADHAFPGQFGPVLSYDIDAAKVGADYPTQ